MSVLVSIADWLNRVGEFWLVLALLGGFIAFLVKSSRKAYALYLLCLSYWLGLALWLLSLVILHDLWGWVGIVLGLLLMGVGVVPLCMIACLLHAEWGTLGQLALSLLVVFACRLISIWISERDEKRRSRESVLLTQLEERVRILEGERQSLSANRFGDDV